MNILCIVLIAMSNVGKSHWSKLLLKLLEKLGYIQICIDDEVEKMLGHELIKLGYKGGIDKVAKWMGQPSDLQYAKNAALYLQYETEAMEAAIARIRKGEKIIFDPTGSVIYTGAKILKELRELALVVYLDVPTSYRKKLFEQFCAEPKPVIWGNGVYSPLPNEMPMDAIKRCYAKLLTSREAEYRKFAHVSIPFLDHHPKGLTAEDFIRNLVKAMRLQGKN